MLFIETTSPMFDRRNTDCVITNVDPFQSTLTITAGGQVTEGAVTNYTCTGEETAEFRSIDEPQSPTRMTAVEVFTISSSYYGASCTASNVAGSDTLKCSFESIYKSVNNNNNKERFICRYYSYTSSNYKSY